MRSTLDDALDRFLVRWGDHVFEDGMDAEFSDDVSDLIGRFDVSAIKGLEQRHKGSMIPPELYEEFLSRLGDVQHPASKEVRFKILTRHLKDPSYHVRSGATLGLEELEDWRSIAPLQAAAAQEEYPLLRAKMKRLALGYAPGGGARAGEPIDN